MPDSNAASLAVPYPAQSLIEGIPVTGFPNPVSLFERIVQETRKAGQSVIYYLNIHVANTAFHNTALKQTLQNADLVYCDGAGIVVGSKMLGAPLPTRLTAADWFIDLLAYLASQNRRVYLLGGEPGVPELALEKIARHIPRHTIVGAHHGFILNAPETTQRVIREINALQPDLLIVGFGTPLQERWIEQNRQHLHVSTIYAIGAVMDFISGKVPRCPRRIGNAGLEWLYRLFTEPSRLMGRYLIGNPWFLSRIALQVLKTKLGSRFVNQPPSSQHSRPS